MATAAWRNSRRFMQVLSGLSNSAPLTRAPEGDFIAQITPASWRGLKCQKGAAIERAMNEPVREPSALSCADDYDPNSMPVAKAREVIARFLMPVTTTERVGVRAALGRVLAEDVVSPLDVPAHDNSAMDGYAVRCADLKDDGDAALKVAGSSFAGAP